MHGLGNMTALNASTAIPSQPKTVSDALMSAFAMFALKDPSLLTFDQRRRADNLKSLFGIAQIHQRHADAGDL